MYTSSNSTNTEKTIEHQRKTQTQNNNQKLKTYKCLSKTIKQNKTLGTQTKTKTRKT